MHEYHGLRDGNALVTALARIARKCSLKGKTKIFAAASEYEELAKEEKSCLKKELERSATLMRYQEALRPLAALYPACPIGFICTTQPRSSLEEKGDIEYVKGLVVEMYDRTSRETTMVQANAIWLAFDSGIMKVTEGVALAHFPEIESYPHTELSEKVAASVRNALKMFFAEPYYTKSLDWPRYFWNRGLELDKCYYEE